MARHTRGQTQVEETKKEGKISWILLLYSLHFLFYQQTPTQSSTRKNLLGLYERLPVRCFLFLMNSSNFFITLSKKV